ncbi:phosphatidylinositol N-acetylglucosaminyltransferase subunit P-like isoform X1 [Arctopsyche grandis]|uniref:phosphatidylinositol N-acetylglucosaminyltransferase subunit P-like isoform X1 n=1 Tax=Arctopsyche grandis TaxID=121162 RepID=UPI00406D7371
MPEHTPAPTQARSIYGFILYLASSTLLVIYLCWALIPDEILNSMNIYYYPQKYWAFAVPMQLLLALSLFAFIIYPCLNLSMTPNIDSMNTIADNFSLKQNNQDSQQVYDFCDCSNKTKCFLGKAVISDSENKLKKIPHVEDLDIVDVCRILYSK